MLSRKWVLVDTDVLMISMDVFTGTKRPVRCDVYRKKRLSGIWKYKYVPRY
jgi:hypothetical protein